MIITIANVFSNLNFDILSHILNSAKVKQKILYYILHFTAKNKQFKSSHMKIAIAMLPKQCTDADHCWYRSDIIINSCSLPLY